MKNCITFLLGWPQEINYTRTDILHMMKIKTLFAVLFFFWTFQNFAQSTSLDSLKLELKAAKADSIKIDLALQLINAYANTNNDSMIYYSLQAADMLKKEFKRVEVDSIRSVILWTISQTYAYVSNDSFVHYAQRNYLFSKQHKSTLPKDAEVRALSNLANSYWWAGNYPDSKEAYFKTLALAEQLRDTMLIADANVKIAMVNRNAGDFRQAIIYYSIGEKLARQTANDDILLEVLVDKGKSYEELGILDSAYNCLQECLAKIYSKYKKDVHGGVQAEMGIIYSKMGRKDLAEGFFRKSFQLNIEEKSIRLLARAYCEYAEHLDRFHHVDSAIFYASKALRLDQRFNLLVQQLRASTLLTKLYKRENKIDSAFRYQSLMIETRDSVFSREKINRLQTLDFNEKLRQEELESTKAKSEEERRQNIQYALIAIGLITIIIVFLFLSRSFITNTKLITFFGIIELLIVFEFLNLLLHPFLERITQHSPVFMLLLLVCIAVLLAPLHHRLEKWATTRLIEKNKAVRLANAKKIIEKLENKVEGLNENSTNA
ncbi:MAG TPA: tetratricopeptide repeat protein [Chitinophagaceae bacterium]|nr:tetratricopeptide repeat protein [Chitinophagaceae bacterium]